MLLVFLISALSISCEASPFNKYPFVFLLDIGNEELGTNSEQIRVTVPGGDLAIKYPATGQGDVIGHVRVTGIDYGTDLKANIVEGGPGYRYVVLVFMGKPGVEYDTVVTIQTLADNDVNTKSMSSQSSYEVKEDVDLNNSAEEIDDEDKSNSLYSEKMNAELTQSSSNVYKYVKNENMEVHSRENVSNENDDDDADDDDNDNDDKDEDDDDDEINKDSIANVKTEEGITNIQQDELDVEDTIQQLDNNDKAYKDDGDIDDRSNNLNKAYIISNINSLPYSSGYPININNEEFRENSNKDSEVTYQLVAGPGRYFALRPRFYGDVKVYPQVLVPQDRSYVDHSEDDDNGLEGQAKDTNNNDYISPVEYK